MQVLDEAFKVFGSFSRFVRGLVEVDARPPIAKHETNAVRLWLTASSRSMILGRVETLHRRLEVAPSAFGRCVCVRKRARMGNGLQRHLGGLPVAGFVTPHDPACGLAHGRRNAGRRGRRELHAARGLFTSLRVACR